MTYVPALEEEFWKPVGDVFAIRVQVLPSVVFHMWT